VHLSAAVRRRQSSFAKLSSRGLAQENLVTRLNLDCSTLCFRYTGTMLFMVMERFRNGDARAVGERFQGKGRMMPDNVKYVASWVDAKAMCCFQLMEAPSEEAMQPWVRAWEDLVEFEIVAVETSQEFWERLARESD